jgi:predicted AAA+ superfamily ATPase
MCIYLNTSIQWSQDEFRKPIVIRGARQVGKSTLVRMLSRKCGFNLVELNSNDPQKNLLVLNNRTKASYASEI